MCIFGLTSRRGAHLNFCIGFVEAVRPDGRRSVRPFTTFHTSPTTPAVEMRLQLGLESVALKPVNLKLQNLTDPSHQIRPMYEKFLTHEAQLWDREGSPARHAGSGEGSSLGDCFSTPIGQRSSRAVVALYSLFGDRLHPIFKFHLGQYKKLNQGTDRNALLLACKLFTELLSDLPGFAKAGLGMFENRLRTDLTDTLLELGRVHAALDVALSMRRTDDPDYSDLPYKMLIKVAEALRVLNDDCERLALDELMFLDDKDVLPHFRLAQYHARRGFNDRARAEFIQALACDTVDPETLTDEGRADAKKFVAGDTTFTRQPPFCSRHLEEPFEVPVRAELRR